MGAYLSEPVTEKLSTDEVGEWLSYGASSMQGWRVSQEDAHNAVLSFDEDTHLFAVYDGHGGHEVSAYTALKLPDFIKETESYKSGNVSQALIDAFLGFDATLVKPEVISILKQIAGTKDDEDEEEEESESESEEVDNLYREATMPLDEVIAKYAENPQLARCKKNKVQSPFLKAKGVINSSEGSSKAEAGSPIKCDLDEEDDTAKPSPASLPSLPAKDSSPDKSKENGVGDQNSVKEETSTEVNGEESKHMVNGEGGDDLCEEKKTTDLVDKEEVESECKAENGNTIVNGDEEKESGKGKGKGAKGGKGKAILKNSEVRAMKEAKAKENKREAAIKAAEIYRKIQEGGAEEDLSDEEEEEEDESFEDEGGEEEECEDEAGEEESEEEEEDVEAEEDEDPYAEFAMNMKEEPGFDSGCTACAAVIRGNELYVANVGDSRCVVCRDGKAIDMSLDHKPEDDPEAARIIRAGGRVTADGRVNGGLNLSRAIGDHGYKQNKNLSPEEQMISPLPDVRSMTLEPKDSFMIVACDGIWNSLTSQEACDYVAGKLAEGTKLSSICEDLFDHCLAPDTHGDGTGCDNMTCIIVSFKDGRVESCTSHKRSSDQAGNDQPSQEEKKAKSDSE